MELKRFHADVIGGHLLGSILVRLVMRICFSRNLADKREKKQWLIFQYLSISHFFSYTLACLLQEFAHCFSPGISHIVYLSDFRDHFLHFGVKGYVGQMVRFPIWLRAGGERGDRGWDGWMVSSTQWTWVLANSRWQWRTRKLGVLQPMELESQTWPSDWTTTKSVYNLSVACEV